MVAMQYKKQFLIASIALTLAACGGGSGGGSGNAGGGNTDTTPPVPDVGPRIHFVHAIPDAADLGLFFLNTDEITFNSGSGAEIAFGSSFSKPISELPAIFRQGPTEPPSFRGGLRCLASQFCGIESGVRWIEPDAGEDTIIVASGLQQLDIDGAGNLFFEVPWDSVPAEELHDDTSVFTVAHAAVSFADDTIRIWVASADQILGSVPAMPASWNAFQDSEQKFWLTGPDHKIVAWLQQPDGTGNVIYESGPIDLPQGQEVAIVMFDDVSASTRDDARLQAMVLTRNGNSVTYKDSRNGDRWIRGFNALPADEKVVLRVGEPDGEDGINFDPGFFRHRADGSLLEIDGAATPAITKLPRGAATYREVFNPVSADSVGFFAVANDSNGGSNIVNAGRTLQPGSDLLVVATAIGQEPLMVENDRRGVVTAARLRLVNATSTQALLYVLPQGADVNAGTQFCGFVCTTFPTYGAEASVNPHDASGYMFIAAQDENGQAKSYDLVIASGEHPDRTELARYTFNPENGTVYSVVYTAGSGVIGSAVTPAALFEIDETAMPAKESELP